MRILESRALRLGRNIKHYIVHLFLYYWIYSISANYQCGLNQYFCEWEHITFWGVSVLWPIRKFLLLNKISLWQNWGLIIKQVWSLPFSSCVYTLPTWSLHLSCWVFSSLFLSASTGLSTEYCLQLFHYLHHSPLVTLVDVYYFIKCGVYTWL